MEKTKHRSVVTYLKSLENGTKNGLYISSVKIRDLTISVECKEISGSRKFVATISNNSNFTESQQFINSRRGFEEACEWLDERMDDYIHTKMLDDIFS